MEKTIGDEIELERLEVAVRIVSLQIGLPQEQVLGSKNRAVTTGFVKSSVVGKVWLGQLNLAGDGQADLVHHGGVDKAVCVYPADHYPAWQDELNEPALTAGSFGENFTISQLTEADVCIGDIWQVGQAVVQISQPRRPCWKLAQRWDIRDLPLRVQATGRTGWYFRVITEGNVEVGDALTLCGRTSPEWTIQAANYLMYHDKQNYSGAEALAEVAGLSRSWQESLRRRAATMQPVDDQPRLYGDQ